MIMKNKKHRNIAVLCILCVSILGFSMWFFNGKSNPVKDENNHVKDEINPARYQSNPAKDEINPDDLIDLDESNFPLGNISTKISAGDIVVVNVAADEMDDVYGYQFDMNYDRDYLEYKKRLFSDIDDIITIFATDKEWYLLVGATMTGDVRGYSGREVPVCRVEFVALNDFDLKTDSSSEHITVSSVNVTKDDLQYIENVDGWTASISVR